MMETAIAALKKEGFLLCIIIPYIVPPKNALKVSPGKYAPFGNKTDPIMSDIEAAIPPDIGPNIIDAAAIGKKPKPNFTMGVLMDKNRERITSIATNIDK